MNLDQNCSYYIEDTLLLQFLIVRFTEMLQIENPNLVPVWSGLGMVALHQNRELESAFKTLTSSGSFSDQEVVTSSIDLFAAELARLESVDVTAYEGTAVDHHSLSQRTARKFLYWCWGEGRKMKGEQEFRFYRVWEVVSWLGLTADEYRRGFEERCRFSDDPMDVRLQQGLEVIKAAIFRRNIGSTSFEQHMLRTGTEPNYKETST